MRRLVALAIWVMASGAAAQAQTSNPQDGPPKDLEAAFQAGSKVSIVGKRDVMLLSQGILHLPDGYMFIPQPEAARISRAMGNTVSDSLVGLVFPSDSSQFWLISVNFVKSGYVRDGEAKDWKPEALLTDLRASNDDANKGRIARGFPQLEIVGWAEAPAYDGKTRRLAWAATTHIKSQPGSELGVNYNTYALGREGVFNLNLETSAKSFPLYKDKLLNLLSAFEYDAGKRFEDINPQADQASAYSIRALVVGSSATKPGFMTKARDLFSHSGKFVLIPIVVLILVLGLITGRLLRKRQQQPRAASAN